MTASTLCTWRFHEIFFSYFRYMDTVNAYRNFSPTSSASSSADNAGNGSSSSRLGPQPFGGKKSDLASPTFGSVSPALSSDSRGGQIQSPSNSNSGLPKSKKSSPGKKFHHLGSLSGIYYAMISCHDFMPFFLKM